jgi:hypothetical protein
VDDVCIISLCFNEIHTDCCIFAIFRQFSLAQKGL